MTQTQSPQIFKAILDIQEELPAILKSRSFIQNGKTMYNFRGIDDLYNHINPLFKKYRVFMTPEILETESSEKPTAAGKVLFYEKMTIRYKLYAEDGSFVEASTRGIGMDSGDKAGNKAMSVAQKYALIQIFSIPTVESKDPEEDSHEVVTRSRQKPKLTPAHEKWTAAVEWLRKPDTTMAKLMLNWDVSPEDQEKLKEEALS